MQKKNNSISRILKYQFHMLVTSMLLQQSYFPTLDNVQIQIIIVALI